MPVMDGVTFLNHLRQRPDQADFEVIVMSALVDPEWFGKLPGVIRAMRKPFDIEEIQTLVSEFADRRPPGGLIACERHQAVSPPAFPRSGRS